MDWNFGGVPSGADVSMYGRPYLDSKSTAAPEVKAASRSVSLQVSQGRTGSMSTDLFCINCFSSFAKVARPSQFY